MTTDTASVHQEADEAMDDDGNVDLEGLDPKAAWDDFTAAWRRFTMGGKWSSVHSALGTFLRSYTPNERRKIWKAKKAVQAARDESSPLWVLVLFERERDRRRSHTKKGKARRARYDAKIADDQHRQAKIREYQARYRAKKASKKPTLRIVK